jgi:CHAD domain-containing protein
MTKRLPAHKSVLHVPDLVLAEIDQARAALERLDSDPLYAFHGARKAIKKARSSARLIRTGDKSASRLINAAGRRAAEALQEARDADSLEQIARAAAIHCERSEIAAIVQTEGERAREDSKRVDRTHAAGQARAMLDEMAGEVQKIDLSKTPGAVMAKGLARTYKRAKKRFKIARQKPDGETLHELRKRVKDWRYHTTALKAVWPDTVKAKRKKAKKAADLLGDHHDLTRLINRLGDRQDPDEPDLHLQEAIDTLKTRRKALESKALKTAKKVFKRDPGEMKKDLKDAL